MTSVGAKLNKFFSLRTAEARSHITVEVERKLIFCLTTGNSWISGSKFTEEKKKKRKKSFYDRGTMNPVRTVARHN